MLGVIPQKRHIVDQARAALRNGTILPTSNVPASRLGYDVYFVTALPSLSRISRANIHHIYETMIWNDRYLHGLKDEILSAIKDGIIDDPFGEYVGRLDEVDHAYTKTQKLIADYLKGSPRDIYPEVDVSQLDSPYFKYSD